MVMENMCSKMFLQSKHNVHITTVDGVEYNFNGHGEYVYKLKKIVGSNNFSAQFIKIISHYKKIGYKHLCIATDCMLGSQPNHWWQLCFSL